MGRERMVAWETERRPRILGQNYAALGWFGLPMTGISFVAVPLAVLWCFLSVGLGRKQVALLQARERNA